MPSWQFKSPKVATTPLIIVKNPKLDFSGFRTLVGLVGLEPMFRMLNRRDSTLWRSLVSHEIISEEISTVEPMFRSLNRRCSPLEQARCSFRANKLRSLAFGTLQWRDASFVCPHDRGAP